MSFDWLDIRFQICNVIVYTLWGKKVQVIFATEIKHDCISIWHLLCKIHKFDWSIMERARKGNSLISFTIWILQRYSVLHLWVCTITKFLLKPDLFWHWWCWTNLLRTSIDSVQLNKYETDPYFFQNFKSNTTVCLIIHAFCKVYEHEIVLIWKTGRTISGSKLVQNLWIIKQTVILLWKFQRKYRSISHSFSCNNI